MAPGTGSLEARLCVATGAERARSLGRIQSLWSGWGEILRVRLEGGPFGAGETVIVKRVEPPASSRHPLGWGSATSDGRKLRSYAVEEVFYRDFAPRLPATARVARALHLEPGLFVLEDLDAAGFPGRTRGSAGRLQVHGCVTWLAAMHARFLGEAPEGLWPVGTYWHLATRPDEHAVMAPGPLKDAAAELDRRLSGARFQTLVHGDAKLANFCFGRRPDMVAAVDFQYVGGGVGLKDLAYLLGSCLHEAELVAQADAWLDHYLAVLRVVRARQLQGAPDLLDLDGLEEEWRGLWPLAWADFERFMAGWAPQHWDQEGFAASMTARALTLL